jgi:hypothetical protein
VQANTLTFDFLLARQRLYSDLDTDFELDMMSLETDSSGDDSPPAGPQPWWGLQTPRAEEAATGTPQTILEVHGEEEMAAFVCDCEAAASTEGQAAVWHCVERAGDNEGAESAVCKDARRNGGAKRTRTQWGTMWAMCKRSLSKRACFINPTVSD